MSLRRVQGPAELDHDTGRELHRSIHSGGIARGETLIVDLSATESVDTPGGAWLIEIAQWVRSKQGDFQLEGQKGTVADFMELIEPGLMPVAVETARREGYLEALGGLTLNGLAEAKDFFGLMVDAIYWTFLALFDGHGFRWGLFVDELHEMGVRAIRINCLMNFLLGLIIAMLSAAQLEQFGASIFVADLLVIAFARELGAIMTAVVVSARTGAAITAEIATMQVQEEIDALRGMGLNVNQFLVAPKVLALLVAMPCLVMLGMISGVIGGTLWGVAVMGVDFGAWTRELLAAAYLGDFFQGILKTLIFAVVIVLIGCHNGLHVTGGSRGVGLMTTRAVVWDIFAIITIDMAFAVVFYYVL